MTETDRDKTLRLSTRWCSCTTSRTHGNDNKINSIILLLCHYRFFTDSLQIAYAHRVYYKNIYTYRH